ncbi:cytochrome P450 [Hypoxylon crocopeplum]|nr:cytochrome P450 [Hypoxylon crocopeplum]
MCRLNIFPLTLLLIFSYRVFFHPLKDYLVPFTTKLTNLYTSFYTLSMRLHLTTQILTLLDIYNNDGVTKSDVYLLTIVSGKLRVVFITLDKQAHRTKRKVMGQATNDKAMQGFESTMIEHFSLLKKLGLHSLLLLLGHPQRMRYKHILRSMTKSRPLQEKNSKTDLYSFVADHLGNAADGIMTTDLWGEALFSFPAGADTTTTVISVLFFYLSRNLHVYTKLASEIRTTFGSDHESRGPKLNDCCYLHARIDKALRKSPRQEPFTIDGHVIPPGTEAGVYPFTFRPERWLVSDKDDITLRRILVIAKTLWHFDFEAALGKTGKAGAGVLGKMDGRGRLAWDYTKKATFSILNNSTYI